MTRACLLFLTTTAVLVGGWALFAPQSFYGAFPGCGRIWIAVDGPYNEHLVRDVGALNLGVAALSGLSAFKPTLVSPFAAGLSTLAFNAPHLAYHLARLQLYGPLDQAGNVLALGLALGASLWLVARGMGARP